MAAEQGGQEKTEQPSDKKRQDTRKEGNVAFSKEISSAALLAGFALVFYLLGSTFLRHSKSYMVDSFNNLSQPDLTIPLMYKLFQEHFMATLPIALPIAGVTVVVAIGASLLQVGIQFTAKPLAPKFSKISPLSGLQRLFSSQALAEFFKSMFKLIVIGYIGYLTFVDELDHMHTLTNSPTNSIILYVFSVTALVTGKIVLALVAIAIFDYLYQRWHFEQQIKMTKQEVKEEMKQAEGDPQLKARIREVQREMSRARMMQEVPKADAIVVNPTHYSVAIRYDRESMIAPQVTAKGVDFMALRMKTIAKENQVPVVEKPVLARELYSEVEVGQTVPDQFYRAVAEILAYVYRLKNKKR